MKKKVVYIAGPISKDLEHYKEKFAWMEDALCKEGFVVLNPANAPEGLTYKQYIHYGIALLSKADWICMLPGSEHSPGACFEKHYAELMGLTVYCVDPKAFN